jgi:hypothetical protein
LHYEDCLADGEAPGLGNFDGANACVAGGGGFTGELLVAEELAEVATASDDESKFLIETILTPNFVCSL